MIKRIAICLMLAGALAGGLVYAARARRALGADAESELLSLAPADSALVAYADLAAIRNSPVTAQLGALAQPVRVDKDYTDFVSATGFDYSKDLDRVLITARSGAPSGDTLIFAEGRFDREKIEKYALRTGKQQTENGHTFYVVPLATAGKSLQFAFLSSGRMALANDGDLSAAFSPAARGSIDSGMRDRLARVSGAPLFAELKASNYVPQPGAAGAPGAPKGSPLAAGMTAPFAALQWISLAARPRWRSDRVVGGGRMQAARRCPGRGQRTAIFAHHPARGHGRSQVARPDAGAIGGCCAKTIGNHQDHHGCGAGKAAGLADSGVAAAGNQSTKWATDWAAKWTGKWVDCTAVAAGPLDQIRQPRFPASAASIFRLACWSGATPCNTDTNRF